MKTLQHFLSPNTFNGPSSNKVPQHATHIDWSSRDLQRKPPALHPSSVGHQAYVSPSSKRDSEKYLTNVLNNSFVSKSWQPPTVTYIHNISLNCSWQHHIALGGWGWGWGAEGYSEECICFWFESGPIFQLKSKKMYNFKLTMAQTFSHKNNKFYNWYDIWIWYFIIIILKYDNHFESIYIHVSAFYNIQSLKQDLIVFRSPFDSWWNLQNWIYSITLPVYFTLSPYEWLTLINVQLSCALSTSTLNGLPPNQTSLHHSDIDSDESDLNF